LTAVTDARNAYSLCSLVDNVDDPVVADAHTVLPSQLATQGQAAGGARLKLESLQLARYLLSNSRR